MAHYSGEGRTRVELRLYRHPTRSVLCSATSRCFLISPRLAQTSKPVSRQKIAKAEVHVALRPDSLTYLFTCGIVIEILAMRILNFYNRVAALARRSGVRERTRMQRRLERWV